MGWVNGIWGVQRPMVDRAILQGDKGKVEDKRILGKLKKAVMRQI
jgi:hypothetical protein